MRSFLFNIFSLVQIIAGFPNSTHHRYGRIYNPIVQLVNFPNDPCTGYATSLTGICYSSEDCAGVTGGYADGRCAQGFGVCCVIRVSECGGTVTQNSTHIQNPSYPNGYTETTSCSFTFKKSSLDICYIRLQFVNFVLRGPDVDTSPYTRCTNDKIEFTTPSANTPPPICGYNNGQHIYMDSTISSLTSNPSMTMTFTGTSFSRYWQIRVDQIPCGTSYTPPHGCVQYYMEPYGNFKSYNYGLNDDDYHHLAFQVYSICIRRAAGRCKIAYAAANEGESFYLSLTPNPNPVKIRSKSGEGGCPADYITIPNGSNSLYGSASCVSPDTPANVPTMDRYCGVRLNCYDSSTSNAITYSSVVPFIVRVDINGAESASDNKNRGFSVDYSQIKC